MASDAPISREKARGSRGWLFWLLGIAVLAAVVIGATHFAEEEAFIRLAREAEPLWLVAALALQAATYLAQGEIWRLVGRIVGRRLRLPFVYKLALAKLFVDQALPSAGVSGTVVVAKVLERSALGREAVLAGIVVNTTSFFIAYTGAIAVALMICYQSGHASAVIVLSSLLFILLSTGLAAGMLALTGKEPTRKVRPLFRYRAIRNALSVVKDADPRLVRNVHLQVVASLYQFITFLLDGLTLWSLIRSVGADADISYVFASFMIANLVRTISFIPGGLGTFDGAVLLMLKAGGVGVAAALSAALLFRGFTFFVPMIPGLWFSRLMTKGAWRSAA